MPELSRTEKPRACEPCSRAKAKCVWPNTNDGSVAQICRRCSNNNLTCTRSQPGPKNKRGKATHAKVIERKLDDIMSLLRDREQSGSTNRAAERYPFSSSSFTPATTTSPHGFDHSGPLTAMTTPIGQSHNEVITVIPGFEILRDEADLVLRNYTTDMLPQFPFVALPASNAYSLYKDKPLLLKTILWICRPPDTDTSAAFERWFRQQIAHRIVVLGEKSLEILQAILVFLAWSDVHFYSNASDTSLLQLAIGLAGDLGLTKCPDSPGPAYRSIVEDAANLRNDVQARNRHTNADRRAVLGVFYITSVLSTLLAKPCRLEHTPYLNVCCRHLLQDPEIPTDSLLVYLIRIRQIAIKVHDTFWQRSDLANERPFRAVHTIAIASIEKELDAFMENLPEPLKSNYLIRNHCTATRIRLLEPAIHANASDDPGPPFFRSRILWGCLKSTQTLLNEFVLAPVEAYPSLTFASMLHLALAIIKAGRLLCMDDHDWDKEAASRSFNLPDMMERVSERFDEASHLGSPRCNILLDGRPFFSGYAERFRLMKSMHLSKVHAPGATDLTSTLIDPGFVQGGDLDFDFWQQLSDLTYSHG